MIENPFWPGIKSFKQRTLKVSNVHTIHYALYGNPNGIPVFFLHGGPGCGCTDDDARWFDPNKFLIITHDQRGSGKSRPLAEIKENKPQLLVGDIEKLRKHLNVKNRFSIFAGSWGSTLALLYAEKYPQNVLRMILRGIFTCSYDEQDYFYSENGAAKFSSEAWNSLIKRIPEGNDRVQERIHKLIENSNEKDKLKWCKILAEYEYSFFNLSVDDLKKELENIELVYPEMRINMYYQANRFFLEDNQIINNIQSIKNIPVTIVHGKNYLICPPKSAKKLHRHLSSSKLILVEARHLSSDAKIKQSLLEAVYMWE